LKFTVKISNTQLPTPDESPNHNGEQRSSYELSHDLFSGTISGSVLI